MNLFDDSAFAQIPGQLSLDTTPTAAPTIVPRMTYREKRERKAERLREWADNREAKQSALDEAARTDETATGIPFGQPILVGHHSERRHRNAIAKIDRAMGAAVENSRKASAMSERADSIEAQNANAIYSDDPDAVEALTAKIARLDAERERIKAYNKTCRKGGDHGDLSLLDAAQQRDLAVTMRVQAYACPNGRFPAYHLQNLGGNISRLKKRLTALQTPETGRWLEARYAGECRSCGADVAKGDRVRYFKRDRAIECEACNQ